MTRDIIDEEMGFQISVNTYWNGKQECVQITLRSGKDYHGMTRIRAIEFFEVVLCRLKNQIVEDAMNPPWWQLIEHRNKYQEESSK